MKKKKNLYMVLGVIVYVIIVGIIYFIMRKYQITLSDNSENRNIYDAVEITDIYELERVLGNNEATYALIYGTFKCEDLVYNIYLRDEFSYIDEVKNDNNDISHNVIKGNSYSIYDKIIPGINFDIMKETKVITMKDIRHKGITYDYYVKAPVYTGTMLCYIENGNITCKEYYDMSTISNIKSHAEQKVYFVENTFLVAAALLLMLAFLSIDDFKPLEEE